MNISQEVKASTGAPVDHHDVAGGRKTVESIIEDAPVLVTMSDDDAIVFSDEFDCVGSFYTSVLESLGQLSKFICCRDVPYF